MTFEPAVNGSYTVDDQSITTTTTRNDKLPIEGYKLQATADTGYQFFAWKDVEKGVILSKEQN